jgi:hypothetical protein
MTVVYIEPRPKGRDGTPIESFAVEERNDKVLHTTKTQKEAIDWAKAEGYTVHVAHVRHTDKGNPDHWRKA